MFRQVHHMGIVTDDLEKAKGVLGRGWGLKVNEDRTPGLDGVLDPTVNARVLEFGLGQGFVRVFKPLDGGSPMGQFLQDLHDRRTARGVPDDGKFLFNRTN